MTGVVFFFPQERLSLRNAELSESLAATQHSRSVLEREALGLRRSLLEARTVKNQLEEALAQVRIQLQPGVALTCITPTPYPCRLPGGRRPGRCGSRLSMMRQG